MDCKYLDFEWDENKNQENIRKHGVDFFTAAMVFGDENYLERFDEEHSEEENRYVSLLVWLETLPSYCK